MGIGLVSDRVTGAEASQAIKAPVKVATTANITLSGEQTIDGVAVVENDRVLVKDQTDATENGIYVVQTTAWYRAKDFNGARDIAQGLSVYVQSGTIWGGNEFRLTTSSPVIGTSNLTFLEIGGDGLVEFESTAEAEVGDTGSVYHIIVNGQLFVYDAAGTDLTTGDARTWTVVVHSITSGGTGANNASDARDNLGLTIGTNVQAWDADLDTYAANPLTAAELGQLQNIDTSTVSALQWGYLGAMSAFGGSLVDDADAATARATLGMVIGTDVQAWNASLQSISSLTTSADKMIYTTASDLYATTALTSFARSILDDADAATARTTLGVVIGTNVQAWDADLDTYAANPLTAAELGQLQNIDTSTVSALQWGYLGAMSAFGGSLVDDADAATARTTLGLGTSAVEDKSHFNGRAALVAGWTNGDADDGALITDGVVIYVAEAGSTVISDLTGLKPYGVPSPYHFGAVGNGTTNDATALQAWIDYAANHGDVWYSDDRGSPNGDFSPTTRIEVGDRGGVFAIETGLTFDVSTRNIVVGPIALKATGTWTVTNFMISASGGNGTYVKLEDPVLNCNGKCSGINPQSFWQIHRPVIRRMGSGGIGIKFSGVKAHVFNPDIKEWTNEHAEFFNESNYGAVGIDFDGNDNRVEFGEIGWCGKLVTKTSGVNNEIKMTHLFNGMENFADYNLDGTFVGGGGGTATGRDDPILLEVADNSPTVEPVRLIGCYLDNGRIDLYDDAGVSIVDCHLNSNSNHSNANQTEWIRNYSNTTGDVNRLVVLNPLVGVKTRAKDLVNFIDYLTNTWSFDSSAFEATTANDMDASNTTLNVAARFDYYSTEATGITLFGQGTKAFYAVRDKDSTGFSRYGVDADQGVIETYNGTLRLEDASNNTIFKVDTGTITYNALSGAASADVNANDGLSNANVTFSSAGAVKWNIGYVDSTGNFTVYDNVNTTTPVVVEAGAGNNTLVVDSNSRVGIGTNAPNAKLGINGASGSTTAQFIQGGDTSAERTILAQSTSGQNFGAYVDASAIKHLVSGTSDVLTTTGSGYTALHSNSGVEFLRGTSSGDVAIGRTSPLGAEKLSVSGDGAFGSLSSSDLSTGTSDGVWVGNAGALRSSANGGVALGLRRRTSDGDIAVFRRDTTQVGSISVTTTATTYNTTSDRRVKDNIRDYDQNSGDKIDSLQPRAFVMSGAECLGFVADEFQAVFPGSVTGEPGGDDLQKIDAGTPEVIATLVREIQSLRRRVEELEGAV